MSGPGPWERIKPAEYYKATDFEKMLWACGVPARHWNAQFDALNFAAAIYEGKGDRDRIAPPVQKDYFRERLANSDVMAGQNRFVCITSHPSDEQALAAASLLAASHIENGWLAEAPVRVRMDDIQDYEQARKLDKAFYPARPEVMFLYNLNENTSRERLQLVRDLILKFEGTYRGVIAACESPLTFARDFLKIEPAEVYHFEGKMVKRMVR